MTPEEIINISKENFFWMHRHPELSEEEFESTAHVRKILEDHHIHVEDIPLKTGLVASIGDGEGPTIAIRGDMDALPLQEKTDLPWKSERDGKMHACGHDFHTSTILGIALSLADKKIHGKVQLIFQPGEENLSGAKAVLSTGVLDHTDLIFGIHCIASKPRGTIVTRPGAMHGSTADFKVIFHGKGAHACRPYQSIDPVLMTSQFVVEAQSIVSRNMDPFHAGLVSITHIEAGSNANIIPDSGFVEGTARTVSLADRELIHRRMQDMAVYLAESYGGNAEFHWNDGAPATDNDPKWAAFVKEIAEAQGLPFVPAPDNLAGEDFAFYQQKIPGVFIQIGTGISPMMHNPAFHVDPDTLKDSIPFGRALVLGALKKLGGAIID